MKPGGGHIEEGVPMKTCLILNPKAAQDQELRETVHALRERHVLDVRVSWETGDVERYTHEAMDGGCEAVIVAGGDGSIHEAVNVQIERLDEDLPVASLGALHYGTGNDFMRSLYTEQVLDHLPHQFLRALLSPSASTVLLDVGCSNDKIFMNAISIGYGASATDTTPRPIKDLLGRSAYTLWGVASLTRMEAFGFELRAGDTLIKEEAWQIVIGNGQYVGGGFRACPEANLQDGLLDIVIVPKMGALQTARAVQLLISRARHLEHEQLIALQVPEATIEIQRELQINADGEQLCEELLDLKVMQKRSRWLLPGPISGEEEEQALA